MTVESFIDHVFVELLDHTGILNVDWKDRSSMTPFIQKTLN